MTALPANISEDYMGSKTNLIAWTMIHQDSFKNFIDNKICAYHENDLKATQTRIFTHVILWAEE